MTQRRRLGWELYGGGVRPGRQGPRCQDARSGQDHQPRVDTPAVTNALYPHAGSLLANWWNEDLICECYPDLLRMADR